MAEPTHLDCAAAGYDTLASGRTNAREELRPLRAKVEELTRERDEARDNLHVVMTDTVGRLKAERDALRVAIDRERQAREAAEKSLDHSRYWYACRFERLREWAKSLPEEHRTAYFSIIANGTAESHEEPSYAQQFNAMEHRAEAAENKADTLAAENAKLAKKFEAKETDVHSLSLVVRGATARVAQLERSIAERAFDIDVQAQRVRAETDHPAIADTLNSIAARTRAALEDTAPQPEQEAMCAECGTSVGCSHLLSCSTQGVFFAAPKDEVE